MEQGEKQEGQKTVVAFVAGLLIGGLLVWVFAASPDSSDDVDERTHDDDAEMADDMDVEMDDDGDESGETAGTSLPPVTVVDSASFSVADQPAGVIVEIGSVAFPTEEGWVVVHEDANGTLGNALGASRFSVSEGLLAAQVRLLRGTIAGNTYHVVLYSENGDKVFDLETDIPLTLSGGTTAMTSFVAQ